eukprot:SAG31_NODE_134_length_23213_cov_5.698624_11_plen_34_part_00
MFVPVDLPVHVQLSIDEETKFFKLVLSSTAVDL